MEAAVAEKEAGMTEWNDGRLDELSNRVDDGFAKVDRRLEQMDQRLDRLDKKVDSGFARLDARHDDLQLWLSRISWTFGMGMLGFAAALIGLIAAKL
jgi:hypothetical protein